MDILRLLLAAALALVALAALLALVWGYLNVPSLAVVPPMPSASPAWPTAPRVSVIVAARDEERHIGAAVTSLLGQSYPDYELIVVDDRSSDRTPEILDALARSDPRLRVVTVRQLPANWLGKNYALHVAAQSATGELLLFTDADVMLRTHALSRAVRLLQIERADHLTVVPNMVVPTWSLALVVNYFMMWFFLWLRPWKAPDPRSSAYVGIGAFNLVRAPAYRAIGGHSRIPLRPDDDLMLGKLLKRAGHRQIVAASEGEVSVEWYPSLGELARGFRKNAFAGLQYSALFAIGSVLGNLALAVWPFVAVWITSGSERALYATAALAQVAGYMGPAWTQRTRPWLALLYPFAALVFVAILTAAVMRTLRRQGIEWRGTTYSLDQLRANKV
jgi:cellulose synthase/poly-beta-1,6-N-acetylglucosamine synthase-like glycosyltransferase